MTAPLRWGIIAPGNIAARFASQLPHSATGALVAVASRDAARGGEFAARFGAERVHGSYQELLDDPEVDAVYIASPHPMHPEWAVRAARAGKHVLCEKPLSTAPALTMAMIEAARESGVVLLEAYMWRFHPQVALAQRLIRDGEIGEVQHVEASFSYGTTATEGRTVDGALGGGGIFDVGGYPLSAATLFAQETGYTPGDPIGLTGGGTVEGDGVDTWATASLTFPSGMTAHVTTGVRSSQPEELVITGTGGTIRLRTPWVVAPDAGAVVEVRRVGAEPRELVADLGAPYALEADALAAAVAAGEQEVAAFGWAESRAIADLMHRWREAVGAVYASERIDAVVPTVTGDALTRRDDRMPRASVDGVRIPLSRLVMGCDNQTELTFGSVMFDDFVERGGNVFDTAYIYGGGRIEPVVGQWIRNRGIRDDIVLIVKGAHTPYCDPESIDRQFAESLERLQTDRADIYFMHRDNPDIPVGEFVDVLDAHVQAGRIGTFGGSNWTTERMDEANAYAKANGKHGFAVLSNHFGLAEAYDVPWAGCVAATDSASKAWLERTQTPLFPWSSQARGFFVRADPNDTSDEELVRCYYGDGNFERLARARQLASEFGVAPTAIALAYVLAQDFPTFPLIGPRSIAETRSSLAALDVQLTPEQMRWLDLRD